MELIASRPSIPLPALSDLPRAHHQQSIMGQRHFKISHTLGRVFQSIRRSDNGPTEVSKGGYAVRDCRHSARGVRRWIVGSLLINIWPRRKIPDRALITDGSVGEIYVITSDSISRHTGNETVGVRRGQHGVANEVYSK
ncbi:hypothetical protein E2C01_090356 [Portunus trituberculatus]|uniref:Uncharacterized protein n=1 Tax=Portunus trituberculatus TaxID=210409 RepID=A0A5B7JK14_PORTR|nr:hypothetical protein [Portunus trituberculatus]